MPDPSILLDHLTVLYGPGQGPPTFEKLTALIEHYRPLIAPPAAARGRPGQLSQQDALLITYGDQVTQPGQRPLQTLADFCTDHLTGVVSGVHILPFYPYTSDDGFSVVDYKQVDPSLGGWDDVARLGSRFRLMFDAVINHISASSEWFRAFQADDPRYRDYFVVIEGQPDLSRVVRPRALPLLTRVETPSGPKQVWTTFSADQIDLNYANPEVLLDVLEVLLFYAARGAELIRMDAIAFLWKEIGTPSIHLPQTHRLIQLMRAALDHAAPHVLLITETNVPHADNVSYFGDGRNEAQLVYNFALPPLTLHAFQTGSARLLSDWAGQLSLPSDQVTFFNFLASHDGIGLNPARGILPESEIEAMVQRVADGGGLVSYKHNPDGSQSPYELNVNYFDALSGPAAAGAAGKPVDRFIAAQAILLALIGMPGIYFHSLFGSRGWPEGVQQTGRSRTINRQKLDRAQLEAALADPGSRRSQVFGRYAQLLRARAASPAFHPYGRQRVIPAGDAVFAVERSAREDAPEAGEVVLCLHNVSDRPQPVPIQLRSIFAEAGRATDLVTGRRFNIGRKAGLRLKPYQVMWLQGRRP